MKIKARIQNLIAENKTKEALEVFLLWATEKNDSQLQHNLINIQARLTRIKQQENLGIIQFSDSLREQSVITNSILELLNDIKDHEDRIFLKNVNNSQNSTKIKKANDEDIQGQELLIKRIKWSVGGVIGSIISFFILGETIGWENLNPSIFGTSLTIYLIAVWTNNKI
jgi:hypothetical protein